MNLQVVAGLQRLAAHLADLISLIVVHQPDVTMDRVALHPLLADRTWLRNFLRRLSPRVVPVAASHHLLAAREDILAVITDE